MILSFSCNKEQVEPTEGEPEDEVDEVDEGFVLKYVYVYEDQQLIESDYSITFPPEGGTKELNIVYPGIPQIGLDLCIFGVGGDIPSITYKKISKPTIFPSAPVIEDENYIQLISITAKENTTSETISHTLQAYNDYYVIYGIRIHITQEPMKVVEE